jgi:NAD(P)H dehydrogenase (quinone)
MTNIAVIYYSSTGNTHRLAQAIAAGAEEAGADVRLLQVPELAPAEAIASNDVWKEHREATVDVPVATLDDLEWADGIAFGTPTRYGLPSAQLKQYLDSTGQLWQQGKLADKAITTFTGAYNRHAGHETTQTALNVVFAHWGSVIVPVGFTDPSVFNETTGNPHGVSWQSSGQQLPDEATLTVATHQGRRLTRFAALIAAVRGPVAV